MATEQWGIFQVALHGPDEGNPFSDVALSAEFMFKNRVVRADGFYDGDGVYRVRCMPDAIGEWRYVTHSNCRELDGVSGAFTCCEPSAGNHGPVSVRNTYHFAYADGTPYWQVGTTCYAWTHQGDELEEQTLTTLASAPFNKMRMCVFPKHYVYNENEPPLYPFERNSDGSWDDARFNPAYFRRQEKRIGQLRDLGIEADLILLHPYDRWGFATMDAASDDRYLRYAVARLAAYRNVWWSMANEYDLMPSKTMADWDRFFRIVQECDPYQHPRSVHNCREFYDHAKPWVTHQSVQRSEVEQTRTWRDLYKKPVVVDECRYEGDIPRPWGCLTAEEMTRRFWETAVRGGYCGHGETYEQAQDVLWWSKGGVLHGQSPARLAFFRRILEQGPAGGHEPLDGAIEQRWPCAGKAGEYYLTYFGFHQPQRTTFLLPEGATFAGEVIDTWNMTTDSIPGPLTGRTTIVLPAKPYVAVRIRRV
jgi:hypothetical protein